MRPDFSPSSVHFLPLGGLLLLASLLMSPAATAAELTPKDPAAAILEELRFADRARTELANGEAAWALERSRLLALIEATEAETQRIARDASASASAGAAAGQQISDIQANQDHEFLRVRLSSAGALAAATLAAIARRLPPGTVPVSVKNGDTAIFEDVIRDLDLAERGASQVAVEVITGERDGKRQAVKMLRVSGAVAWWVALDGQSAGTVHFHAGSVQLLPVLQTQQQAIVNALAQAEGRQAPSIVLLPVPIMANGQP